MAKSVRQRIAPQIPDARHVNNLYARISIISLYALPSLALNFFSIPFPSLFRSTHIHCVDRSCVSVCAQVVVGRRGSNNTDIARNGDNPYPDRYSLLLLFFSLSPIFFFYFKSVSIIIRCIRQCLMHF